MSRVFLLFLKVGVNFGIDVGIGGDDGRRWRGGGKFFIDAIGGGRKVMVVVSIGNGVLRETHSVTSHGKMGEMRK